MSSTAKDQQQTSQHGPQPRPEPRVVITGTLPLGEAVLEEVVVAFTGRATEDIGDDVQTGGSLVGFADGLVDLALRWTLVDVDALLRGLRFGLVLGGVGDEGALDLVRVYEARFLAVSFVEGVLVGVGRSP